MFDYLINWLADIQLKYGVNPVIFAILYFTGAIPFWFSIYKIITGLKNKHFAQVRMFGIVLLIIILLPFSYVALFGHNLPFWFWVIAILIIGYTFYSVVRRVRSTSKTIKD